MASLNPARWLALLVPASLLGGAWIAQLGFGLAPCEMCHWQRWPHYAALGVAVLAFGAGARPAARPLVLLAALLIAVSGAIGVFHAGVEYGWWEGLTQCASSGGPVTMDEILGAPLVRCDVAAWTLWGVSLAGFNAIFSFAGAGLVLLALRRADVVAGR